MTPAGYGEPVPVSPLCEVGFAKEGRDIPPLAEKCIAVDRHHKGYAWSVTRASNILVMRATYFLDDTGQLDAYARWEQKQRGISPALFNSDEPDTVSRLVPAKGRR